MAVAGANGARSLQFGTFEVDLRAGELRRNGSKVKLQEQPFQVLTLLLEQPGEVITREEIQKRLWPADTFVDFDHSLNAAIRRLRDALGDSAENPRFVETVARRGYRFVAPVNGASVAVAAPVVRQFPESAVEPRRRRIVVSVLILLIGAIGGAIVANWPHPPMQIKQWRLTANPEDHPVLGAAISPDGKYLAFSDHTGSTCGRPRAASFIRSGFPRAPRARTDGMVSGRNPFTRHLGGSANRPSKPVGDLHRGWVAPQTYRGRATGHGFARRFPDRFHPRPETRGGTVGHASRWRATEAATRRTAVHVRCACCGHRTGSVSPLPTAAMSRQSSRLPRISASSPHANGHQETILPSASRHSLLHSETDSGHLGPGLVWTRDNQLIYSVSEPRPNQQDSNLWTMQIDSRGHITGTPVRLTATRPMMLPRSARQRMTSESRI